MGTQEHKRYMFAWFLKSGYYSRALECECRSLDWMPPRSYLIPLLVQSPAQLRNSSLSSYLQPPDRCFLMEPLVCSHSHGPKRLPSTLVRRTQGCHVSAENGRVSRFSCCVGCGRLLSSIYRHWIIIGRNELPREPTL